MSTKVVKKLIIKMPLTSHDGKTNYGEALLHVDAASAEEWELKNITGITPQQYADWNSDTGWGLETVRAHIWDNIDNAFHEDELHELHHQAFLNNETIGTL